MISKLVINIPVRRSDASPVLETKTRKIAQGLATYVTRMSGANDDQKHALANFLFLNYPDFFYHLEVATTEQSSGISLPTPPSNTRSITQPSQGAQRSERNPKQSQSRQEPSGNDNARDEDIFQFVNFPPNSEDLENAKSRIGKQYHEGLEIILGKDLPTDVFVNLDNITFVVRAGYAALRPDLKRFTDEMLCTWLVSGLWPYTCSNPEDDEIWRQCSIDMMHVGIEKDPETRTMLRRVAQIRMYYWYEEQVKRVREMQPADALIFSDDILEKATYTLLERFYSAWKITDHVSREELRKTFEAEKEVGKKWCELVYYLGEGILVICGKIMDTQMNRKSFSSDDVHTLATFIINCYPQVPQVCRCFDSVVKTFIQKGVLSHDELRQWHDELNWDVLKGGLQEIKQPPQQPVSWFPVEKLSTMMDLTNFIRSALHHDVSMS